jgi:hypothetical protein
VTERLDWAAPMVTGRYSKSPPQAELTTLHDFDITDGCGGEGLMQATDGNFYGSTVVGYFGFFVPNTV